MVRTRHGNGRGQKYPNRQYICIVTYALTNLYIALCTQVLHWFDRVLCFPRIRGSAEQLVRPRPDQHGVRQQILDQVQRAAAMFSGYL
jgi:hypothetical protein